MGFPGTTWALPRSASIRQPAWRVRKPSQPLGSRVERPRGSAERPDLRYPAGALARLDRGRAYLLHAPLMLFGRSLALGAFPLGATLAFNR